MGSDRTLETWDSWVDEAIQDARDRGDFDNLPGEGRPHQVERNPFAGDRELGFHVLKNANLLPRWMELDREISRAVTELDQFCIQSNERLARLRTSVVRNEARAERFARKPRFADLLWGSERFRSSGHRPVGWDDVERERQHLRRRYLERSAAVDKLIQEFNQALPDEIRWLERGRLLPEQAAARFDAVCARVDDDYVDSSQ
jgi:hypothetical protein